MHPFIASILFVLMFTVCSIAEVPKGNVFLGYSLLNADTNTQHRQNINGWNASFEGKVLPFTGVVADFGGHYRNSGCTVSFPPSCTAGPGTVHTFLLGLRLSASISRARPFAHALFGTAHTGANHVTASGVVVSSDTSFAAVVGGGVDFRFAPILGWRVQADYLQTRFFNNTQNNMRLSTGLVLRF